MRVSPTAIERFELLREMFRVLRRRNWQATGKKVRQYLRCTGAADVFQIEPLDIVMHQAVCPHCIAQNLADEGRLPQNFVCSA